MKQKLTFEGWMRAVGDNIASIMCGLSHDDLPDCCYRDWYDDGRTPQSAALEALKNANE
jgi:hypothetical protein